MSRWLAPSPTRPSSPSSPLSSRLVAVFLSCIGLYGLMSYLVSRRTGEIGIRMALGANRSEVGWQVMREIGLLVFAGIVVGLPVAIFGIRLVRNMLYGLSGTDPFSLTAAIGASAVRRNGRRILAGAPGFARRPGSRPS